MKVGAIMTPVPGRPPRLGEACWRSCIVISVISSILVAGITVRFAEDEASTALSRSPRRRGKIVIVRLAARVDVSTRRTIEATHAQRTFSMRIMLHKNVSFIIQICRHNFSRVIEL